MSVNRIQLSSRIAAFGVVFSLALVVATAWGSGSAPSPPRQSPPPAENSATQPPETPDSTKLKAARAEAEQLYSKGYDEAQEGKKLLKDGKADDAKKKFGKALKKFQGAVERDDNYFQAWNMVGFCSRKTGDLKAAFSAYEKCLSISPDYEEAHEYLGEAYVQSGNLDQAKVQLAWLRAHDSDEADDLAESISAAAAKKGTTAN